jgi:hypothetical protein
MELRDNEGAQEIGVLFSDETLRQLGEENLLGLA